MPIPRLTLVVVGGVTGAMLGYFAGVFSAAVFLVGDSIRIWLIGPTLSDSQNESPG